MFTQGCALVRSGNAHLTSYTTHWNFNKCSQFNYQRLFFFSSLARMTHLRAKGELKKFLTHKWNFCFLPSFAPLFIFAEGGEKFFTCGWFLWKILRAKGELKKRRWLPPLEVFNATLLHELCLKYFSNLLWFTSHNRAYYTSWIHAWSLPQTVASKFILEICHNAFLLNLCFKCPTNHLPMFHLSSNIISKISLEITHK